MLFDNVHYDLAAEAAATFLLNQEETQSAGWLDEALEIRHGLPDLEAFDPEWEAPTREGEMDENARAYVRAALSRMP